ncbi:unnamed protein product [Ectocarpus sp. CCAP 1310/34]|nr:unnamed protein product [Ectocarpus sp. CCAP 1310/34]
MAPSDWPTTAPTRPWPYSHRVHPIFLSPTRKWLGYSTNRPPADHAHEHTSLTPRTRVPTLPTAGGRGPNTANAAELSFEVDQWTSLLQHGGTLV